jgi:hypothetical protein
MFIEVIERIESVRRHTSFRGVGEISRLFS